MSIPRWTFVLLLLYPLVGFAQLRVAGLFNDAMVLQRGEETRVWGTASAGEAVSVSIQSQRAIGRADRNGRWQVTLPRLEAGGPYALRIEAGTETLTLANVLIGDVYLASGQSNMEWRIENGIATPERVADLPRLRYAKMYRTVSRAPADTATLEWFTATGDAREKCSAVAYFFARKLIEEEDIPIGIIENAIGGSPVESWISADVLAPIPAFRGRIQELATGQVDLGPRPGEYAEMKKNAEENTARFQRETAGIKLPRSEETTWRSIRFPASLERTGLYNFDGNIWLRKDFFWPHPTQGTGRVGLGRIDDDDHTYLNDTYLGSTFGENEITEYPLPEGVLKKGYNTLWVKLHDRHYNGGLLGPAGQLLLTLQGPEGSFGLPLDGEWSYFVPGGERVEYPYYHLPYFEPTVLYNSSIHPLRNLRISGVIWYQGESNSGRGVQYRTLFQRMIQDWRIRFKQGYLPFIFVQLANFQAKSPGTEVDYWAELREAQAMALELPNTAMVTAIDVGEEADIHPRNKLPVGERLAAAAQNLIYGKRTPYTGPVLSGYDIVSDSFLLSFEPNGRALTIVDEPYTGFVVAGADRRFFPARVEVVGPYRVKVWSDRVRKPEALRYAWAQNPYLSLFDDRGLPAPPFRTDDWAEKSKYK